MRIRNLERVRKFNKMSRRKLSDLSGFPASTIVVYENGRIKPSHKYLEFCSLYFGYSYESLCDYETEKELEPFKNKAFRVLEIYRIMHKMSYRELYNMLLLPIFGSTHLGKTDKEALSCANEDALKNIIINNIDIGIKSISFEYFGFGETPKGIFDEKKELITPKIYANFVKTEDVGNEAKELANKGAGLDAEILEALQGVNDDAKKSILALLNQLKSTQADNKSIDKQD